MYAQARLLYSPSARSPKIYLYTYIIIGFNTTTADVSTSSFPRKKRLEYGILYIIYISLVKGVEATAQFQSTLETINVVVGK